MGRPRRCRKRPPWHYENCPPGICKRCYYAGVWPDRPAAHKRRHTDQSAAAAFETAVDPLDDLPGGSRMGPDGSE